MYEQIYMDAFKPEYNVAPRAGSQLGLKMSDEARAKMSAAASRTRNFTGRSHSAESRAKISANRKGKGGGPRTPERLAKIGDAHRGRPKSEEHRAKIAATLTGHKQTPEQIAKRRASMPAGHYERVAAAKRMLTDEQVREIRSNPGSQASFARRFGISASAVSKIKARLTYASVN